MLSPSTVIETSARGAVAGPLTTEPSSREKALPWQLQGISPSLDALTEHPWWVQVALNALKSPSVGWVTTTFSASNTAQPPTGMSDVLASAAPPAAAPPSLLELDGDELGSDDDESLAVPVSSDPQAARTGSAEAGGRGGGEPPAGDGVLSAHGGGLSVRSSGPTTVGHPPHPYL